MDQETLDKINEWCRTHFTYDENEAPFVYKFDLEQYLETLVITKDI